QALEVKVDWALANFIATEAAVQLGALEAMEQRARRQNRDAIAQTDLRGDLEAIHVLGTQARRVLVEHFDLSPDRREHFFDDGALVDVRGAFDQHRLVGEQRSDDAFGDLVRAASDGHASTAELRAAADFDQLFAHWAIMHDRGRETRSAVR